MQISTRIPLNDFTCSCGSSTTFSACPGSIFTLILFSLVGTDSFPDVSTVRYDCFSPLVSSFHCALACFINFSPTWKKCAAIKISRIKLRNVNFHLYFRRFRCDRHWGMLTMRLAFWFSGPLDFLNVLSQNEFSWK